MDLDPRIHTRESYDIDAYPVALDTISKALRYALQSPSLGKGTETSVLTEIQNAIYDTLDDLDQPSRFLFQGDNP